jgi:3-deoxy-7-phosphoheptulonate synthase
MDSSITKTQKRNLTDMQEKFLDVLFTEAQGNPREAARIAGYSDHSYPKVVRNLKKESGLPIVSEIMDVSQINQLSMDTIDYIQVGTRNFQNYTLLDELGKLDKPILLKRGTWGTLDEILGACERILVGGNEKLAICLRGVVGMPSYRHIFPSTRWAPDLMMIPALKEFCDIPIIYDPSHSTGYRNFVKPISKAAIAAGADGLIIESHPEPEKSISDADQAISIETLKEIMEEIK